MWWEGNEDRMESAPHTSQAARDSVNLPSSTAWPFVLALGCALIFAGLVTSAGVSFLGAILALSGCTGWFLEVLPHEKHEHVAVEGEAVAIVTAHHEVTRIEVAPEIHRAKLPIEIYPVSAGVKGGLAGSVAMAVLACLYGVVKHASVWYPINLLAAVVYANPMEVSMAEMERFHIELLVVASALHLATSILMGLLYGAMLPMFPRRPIVLGGLIAPLMWSGLLYATMGIINPLMALRIDWAWFVASQIAFGVVAGLIVVRQAKVRTTQFMPFAVRAGMEVPGMMEERKDEGQR
jgi:hypothetical protein